MVFTRHQKWCIWGLFTIALLAWEYVMYFARSVHDKGGSKIGHASNFSRAENIPSARVDDQGDATGFFFGLHWGKPFRRGKSWWCVGSHDLSMISRWPICLLIVYLSVYKPICIYLSIYPSIHLSSWQYDTLWYNLIHYNILYYIIQQYTTIYCNLKQCNTIQYNIINTVR